MGPTDRGGFSGGLAGQGRNCGGSQRRGEQEECKAKAHQRCRLLPWRCAVVETLASSSQGWLSAVAHSCAGAAARRGPCSQLLLDHVAQEKKSASVGMSTRSTASSAVPGGLKETLSLRPRNAERCSLGAKWLFCGPARLTSL